MKKIFYSFIGFFVVLIVAIVFAANSSWVIKKVADKFAPEYKISYDDITGNIFTGLKISKLQFDNKLLSKRVDFSWNPSKLLYKRVAINKIGVEALNVDVVKALVASFSSSEESSTEPLPLVILVDEIEVSVNAFEEQGVLLDKTILNIEDMRYASDSIEIDNLSLVLDTNITNILLNASLNNGRLKIDKLFIDNVDSVTLEKMFLSRDNNSTEEDTKRVKNDEDEAVNSLIPVEVELNDFRLTVNSRVYESAQINEVELTLNNLNTNVYKLMKNEKNALTIDKYTFVVKSNLGDIDLIGDLQKEIVTLEQVSLKNIDTLGVQELIPNDNNESNTTKSEKSKTDEETNHLIPKYLIVKKIDVDVLSAKYAPVNINELNLTIEDVKVNVEKLLVERANIDLNVQSNLSNIKEKGKVIDNHFSGRINITPNKRLFELYELPLRKEAIGDIIIDLNASKEEVIADVKAKARHILITKNSDDNMTDSNATKEFNIDIDSLLSHIVYNIKENSLNANSTAMITTPYAENISITNNFKMDNKISYNGKIKVKELLGIDKKFTKPVENLIVDYMGDIKSIKADILSKGLNGYFISDDFKKGDFHLETVKSIIVRDMVELPSELNATEVNAIVDVPLNFMAITPLNIKVKVLSNVTNLDIDMIYGDRLETKITSTIPDNSLLKSFDKNIKWNAISPLVIDAKLNKKDVNVKLKSKELFTKLDYFLKDGKIDGKIQLGGLETNIQGLSQDKITINTNIHSMKSLLNSIQSIYTLDTLPPVEGALNLSMEINQLKEANLKLTSPKLIISTDHKTDHNVNDVEIVLNANSSEVVLKSYKVTYDKMNFFATKPSKVSLKDTTLTISSLWFNDELKVIGEYNLKTAKGEINAIANKLHFSHEIIDLDTKVEVKTILNEGKTSVKGEATLLGGNIKYDMSQKSFASDSDIIIVQDIKDEKESPFMQGLSMLINVKTKKPLIYNKDAVNIKAKVELGIHKAELADLMVLGSVEILKGGSYTFEGKKFVIDKSFIYFTGNPNKPLLDINVNYKSINHLISIRITGTPEIPNINFSSKPSLSREQILSVILFDSEGGAGTNSGDEMMKMMGGAMAKSVLSNMGVQLDHLVIGTDGSIEVGKKITDKIMFIYINDEIPQVKVKYHHSPEWESVISADEESESYDIVYKKDFSSDDITFSR